MRRLLDFVKFEHTVFSIPLLLAGAFLGAGGVPSVWPLFWIVVAGTGPVEPDGSTTRDLTGVGDAAAQADRCLAIIIAAIEELGGSAKDVVRTRMLLTDFEDQEAVGEVHARYFGEARPAATMAGVAWLCRREWKVEIEAEAILPD